MRNKKAKSIRRLAASLANPHSPGLLGKGTYNRQHVWSPDSRRYIYQRLKRMHVRVGIPKLLSGISRTIEQRYRKALSLQA